MSMFYNLIELLIFIIAPCGAFFRVSFISWPPAHFSLSPTHSVKVNKMLIPTKCMYTHCFYYYT